MALRPPGHSEVAQANDGHGQAMLADAAFRVDVTQEQGAVRVCPVGDVDVATVGRLRERMNEAMAAAVAERVILDLRATTFLDSSGVHLVVDTDNWATRSGTEFVIIAGPPAVQHTFDVAGLSGRPPFVRHATAVLHDRGSTPGRRAAT